MNRTQEVHRPALTPEEAALLPAMRPRTMAGSAALSAARQAEERLKGRTVGREVPWGEAESAPETKAPQRRAPRAALNHALGKRAAGGAKKWTAAQGRPSGK